MRAWSNRTRLLAALLVALAAAPARAQSAPPQPAPEERVVRPSEVTVLSGSVFRVGDERYQVAGVRTPRPRGGRCLLERRKGREARTALRRLLRRGEIRLTPTGQVGPRGERFVRVVVDRRDVGQRLLDRRIAVPRQASEGRNPWCLNMR